MCFFTHSDDPDLIRSLRNAEYFALQKPTRPLIYACPYVRWKFCPVCFEFCFDCVGTLRVLLLKWQTACLESATTKTKRPYWYGSTQRGAGGLGPTTAFLCAHEVAKMIAKWKFPERRHLFDQTITVFFWEKKKDVFPSSARDMKKQLNS